MSVEIPPPANDRPKGDRVLFIGLDGATFQVLQPLCDAGFMPNLARMLAGGAFGTLLSTVPPISAPAWTTFITGKNPGKHGILHFVSFDWQRELEALGQGVEISPGVFAVVNANSIRDATLWQMVSKAGRRLVSMNVPMTYPPKPVNGLMVACMLTPPNAKEFTFPAQLKDELGDYEIELNLKEKDFQTLGPAVITRLIEIMDKRATAALGLMQRQPWDLFALVFTETDRIQHRFWHELVAPDGTIARTEGAYAILLRQFYSRLDHWIGRLTDAAGPTATTVIMSDHGFTAMPRRHLYMQGLAQALGLFSFARASTLGRLRAFGEARLGLSYAALYGVAAKVLPRRLLGSVVARLRRSDRSAQATQKGQVVRLQEQVGGVLVGAVPDAERVHLLDDLRARLLALQDPHDGRKVVRDVRRSEEVYSGPFVARFPPLVFFLERDYALASGTGPRGEVVAHTRATPAQSGTHDREGILALLGQGVRPGRLTRSPSIEDVTATILYCLGIDIPSDIDGRVLTEAFEPSVFESRPVSIGDANLVVQADAALTGYSQSEEEAVAARLRGLGYIE